MPGYKPREKNVIQEILQDHFKSFEENYDTQYSEKYGKYRIIHIKEIVKRFVECGDYSKGIARIKCTNTHCGHEHFHPFSCKSGYLCPTCNQKRLLLFSEHLSENVLLKLPHRQFVFTLPKLLRPYFKYDRNILEDVSRIIFSIIHEYYTESAATAVKTGIVILYQSFGDLMRWNPHYHCIVLEGGIDEAGSFHHIPIKDTAKLIEIFRRRVIKLFVDRGLLDSHFARKILSWNHSGFSVDNSVPIPASSRKARVNLSQYIVRHPVSLQKILYARSNGTIIYKTKYNEYWKENIKLFKALDFIAELTRHIPPKGCQYIRRYGLYASRTKGKWPEKHHVLRLAPPGWKKERLQASQDVQPYDAEAAYSVSDKESRSTWARLIAQVYEVNLFACPCCSAPMRVLAVITEPEQVRKILRHLVKIGRSPPGFDPASLN